MVEKIMLTSGTNNSTMEYSNTILFRRMSSNVYLIMRIILEQCVTLMKFLLRFRSTSLWLWLWIAGIRL